MANKEVTGIAGQDLTNTNRVVMGDDGKWYQAKLYQVAAGMVVKRDTKAGESVTVLEYDYDTFPPHLQPPDGKGPGDYLFDPAEYGLDDGPEPGVIDERSAVVYSGHPAYRAGTGEHRHCCGATPGLSDRLAARPDID